MAKLTESQLAINERVYQVYIYLDAQGKGIQKGDFCESIGLDGGNFSKYFNPGSIALAIPPEAIGKIATLYNVDSMWLLTGAGVMKPAEKKAAGNAFSNQGQSGGTANQVGGDQNNSPAEALIECKTLLNAVRKLYEREVGQPCPI